MAQCNWNRSGAECQFKSLKFPLYPDSDERFLCPLHLDFASAARHAINKYEHIRAAVERGLTDFDGVYFPAGHGHSFSAKEHETVSLRHCTFENKTTLEFQQLNGKVRVEFASPTLQGKLTVFLPPGKFDATRCTFQFKLHVIPTESKWTEYKFKHAGFWQALEIERRLFGIWDFSRATFLDRLRLTAASEKAHIAAAGSTVNFHNAKFVGKACTEHTSGHYRLMREAFAENSDRDNETLFYELEKRSQRDGLPKGIVRGTSALYDWCSAYGGSYVRPLLLFVGVQIIAGLGYAGASCNYRLALAPDLSIPSFTLGQLFKPFEQFGKGIRTELMTDVMGKADPTSWWAIGTMFHSVLSLALFTLFVLALRWRFKRD